MKLEWASQFCLGCHFNSLGYASLICKMGVIALAIYLAGSFQDGKKGAHSEVELYILKSMFSLLLLKRVPFSFVTVSFLNEWKDQ